MAAISFKLLSVIILGIFLRYSFRYSSYYREISKRVELSSPLSSWTRVIEGIKLKQLNIHPYDGDTFHESPLYLKFYQLIHEYLSEFQLITLFIAIDLLTAFILSQISAKQLNSIRNHEQTQLIQAKQLNDDKKLIDNLLIKPQSIVTSGEWIIWIYMLSPFAILPCVAQSTQIFQNFLISMVVLMATNGQWLLALTLLALVTLNTFYSVIFLLPIVLILERHGHNGQDHQENSKSSKDPSLNQPMSDRPINFRSICSSIIVFVIIESTLLTLCLWLENGDWRFVESNYLYVFKVIDLQPNIGLFWYFFAEIFDHFRHFFLWVFQLNYFLYIVPLTLRLYRNPHFLMLVTIMNYTVFRPYPTLSDFSLYLSLLPQWYHLFGYMKSTLVVFATFATATALAPILWYLWIVLGTANSNFYFGIMLAFNVAQIFLLTDLIFAHIKREYYLENLDLYIICKKTGKSPKIELNYN